MILWHYCSRKIPRRYLIITQDFVVGVECSGDYQKTHPEDGQTHQPRRVGRRPIDHVLGIILAKLLQITILDLLHSMPTLLDAYWRRR